MLWRQGETAQKKIRTKIPKFSSYLDEDDENETGPAGMLNSEGRKRRTNESIEAKKT